jgi:hypothetical protein
VSYILFRYEASSCGIKELVLNDRIIQRLKKLLLDDNAARNLLNLGGLIKPIRFSTGSISKKQQSNET